MLAVWTIAAALLANDGRLVLEPFDPPPASPYYDGSAFEDAVSGVVPAQYAAPPVRSPPLRSPTIPSRQPAFVDDPPASWKPGWLKGGRATAYYVPASAGEFGFSGLDVRATGTAVTPLLSVTPQANVLWAEGPDSAASDVPGTLLAASVEVRWFQPLSQSWALDLAVSPGLYTDGESTGGDAFRITGRALGFYKWNEGLRLAVGAVYLGRDDIVAVPAVGAMIFPSEDTRIELLFPRPRVAHRIFNQCGVERWAYVAGEWGGGQWAVERADGSDDTLRIRDLRFLAGLEQKNATGGGWLLEGGFVFGREVEYESERGDFEPDLAAIVRAGVTF